MPRNCSSWTGALGFSALPFRFILDRFFGFCTKKLRIFGFGDYCGFQSLFYFALGFRFLAKTKLRFQFAVRCGLVFFQILCGKYAPYDLNHVHVFSDLASGFRFLSKFISVLRIFIIICTVFRFIVCSNAPFLTGT